MRILKDARNLSVTTVLAMKFAHARHEFTLRAKETLLDGSANFVLTISLAWAFGLAGLGTAAVLSVLVPSLFLWARLKLKVRWTIDRPRLRRLIATGLPYSVTPTPATSPGTLTATANRPSSCSPGCSAFTTSATTERETPGADPEIAISSKAFSATPKRPTPFCLPP